MADIYSPVPASPAADATLVTPAVTPAVTPTTPAPASAVPVDPAVAGAAGAEATTETTAAGDPNRDPSTGRFTQRTDQLNRQIGDLVSQKRSLERQVTALQDRSQTLRQSLGQQQPANFDQLPFEQQQAFFMTRAVRADRLEQTESEARDLARHATQTAAAVFHAKVDAVRDRIPDIDQVMGQFGTIPLSDHACNEIADSEKGPEIAYWLAKNPIEARRITALHPMQQAVEIARIEGRVAAAPVPKRISSAPPPPQTVGGGSGPSGVDLATADYVSYRRARMGQG